jgi:hypothetical protein
MVGGSFLNGDQTKSLRRRWNTGSVEEEFPIQKTSDEEF